MEVTPEIFAWLTNLNVINPFESFSRHSINDFLIPERTISALFGGKYMDLIIEPLQSAYNNFYNKEKNYIYELKKLKQIPEGQEYIANNLKYNNWKIIFEVLAHFGLNFTENDLSLIIDNNIEQLKKIISKIYYLYTKLNKTNDSEKLDLMFDINNTKFLTQKESKKNNINNNNVNKIKKKAKNAVLNINDIDTQKKYEYCSSVLEFIILSLCKNLNMRPRQAIALLSNNRKYLKKVCMYGYIFDFQVLKNLLNDIDDNKSILIDLISYSEDSLNIFYSTVGTLLYCKELDISLQACRLINDIKFNIGLNWDWFCNEGIDCFIFILNKETTYFYKKEFSKILCDLIKDNNSLFFENLKKKFNTDKKSSIYDFLANIMPIANIMEKDFIFFLQKFIFDICLSKNNDISYNLSLLSECFYNLNQTYDNNDNVLRIINYFKDCIRSNTQNIFGTAISRIFYLMQRFGEIKNKYAPQLYKNIVFLCLENYDNESKRELFLINIEKFFNDNKDIPIDIFLEPYLNQITGCQNYALCDFLFLLKMVEHPRIESKDIFDIIQFILNVCLYNVYYTRSANLILSLIFESDLINKKCKESYIKTDIEDKFINFIKTALDIYISNILKQEDKFILETPYEIMSQNFFNVNSSVKKTVVNCVKKYRKIKGFHSNGLLAMMWFYEDNDDIMMQIEEINRPIYEPMKVFLERKKLAKIEKDKHDYTKRLILNLSRLREKKLQKALEKEIFEEEKRIKQERIRKKLLDKERVMKMISGGGDTSLPHLYGSGEKLIRNYSDLSGIKNLLFRPKKSPKGKLKSNILIAMSNASRNYYSGDNSKIFNLKSNIKIRRNNSELSMYRSLKESEVKKYYSTIMNKEKFNINDLKETDIKKLRKREILKLLLREEDTVINQDLYKNNKRYFLDKNIFIKYLGMPLNLDEEEERELISIKAYNKEYRNNLVYYFKMYSNEFKQKITKSKLMRLLRDIGIDKRRIEYKEITILIRLMFSFNISEFDFNQFINVLMQLSYIIYIKLRPCLTIGETYSNLIKRFTIVKSNEQQILYLKKKYKSVIKYLLQLKKDKQEFNIPEGFKFVQKTFVKYNYRLAPHMVDYLGEARYICYQILEEIIFDACNSSLIEPYVEIYEFDMVEIEPEKIHNWSPDLTIAYIDLDVDLKFHGLFAADALEEGIRKILKKSNEDDDEEIVLKTAKGIFNPKWAKQGIQIKKEFNKKQIIENQNKNTLYENEKNKYKANLSMDEYLKIKEKFKEVQKKIEYQKNERRRIEENKEKIEIEKREEKNNQMKPIYIMNRKKLKEQFKTISEKKQRMIKEKFEEEQKQANKLKRKDFIISDIDKNYKAFEKNINNSIKKILEKKEIKAIMNKYEPHLKVIYDIYSQKGCTKMGINLKVVLFIDAFYKFLSDFSIFGTYISIEQINWTFKNISKVLQNERNDEMYFDFNDFKLSICYLTIFSKIENKNWKMMVKDIEKLNEENLEKFFKKMGLKLPFNKLDIVHFINDKKNMSMKELINKEHLKKIEELIHHKKNKNEKINKNIIKHNDDKNATKNNNTNNIININNKNNENDKMEIKNNENEESNKKNEIINDLKNNEENNNNLEKEKSEEKIKNDININNNENEDVKLEEKIKNENNINNRENKIEEEANKNKEIKDNENKLKIENKEKNIDDKKICIDKKIENYQKEEKNLNNIDDKKTNNGKENENKKKEENKEEENEDEEEEEEEEDDEN
jgi:hypothetical protein